MNDSIPSIVRKLSDILAVMDWLYDNATDGSADGEEKFTWRISQKSFPYGLWFRGEQASDEPLTPSVFRKRKDSGNRYDERHISNHLQSRVQEIYDIPIDNPFHKLCVAQHYNIPTRLLDWTESILVAAFFAVWKNEESKGDAKIYVLNARSLNAIGGMSEGKGHIHTPRDFGTCFRALAAFRTNRQDWALALRNTWPYFRWSMTGWTYDVKERQSGKQFERFLDPVAVMPSRTHQRMIVQSSVFTLHGGSYCWETKDEPHPLPPKSEFPDKNGAPKTRPVYMIVTIPADAKNTLKDELFRYGIHEATLFPEMEHQRAYLTGTW